MSEDDDALLASAFRKILSREGDWGGAYVDVGDNHITLDATWTVESTGLTPDEMAAIRRAEAHYQSLT